MQADIFVVAGTSMVVYPAAGLIDYVRPGIPIFVIDPNEISVSSGRKIEIIKEKASLGVQILIARLMQIQ